jgi:hypothetical protein
MTKALILEPHKPSHNLAWSGELKKDQVIFERPLIAGGVANATLALSCHG